MKKHTMIISIAILILCTGMDMCLKYIFGLDLSPAVCLMVGVFIGLSASVGYVHSKLEDLHEE